MNNWSSCPRCGSQTFERLTSYGHCVECLYFSDTHTNPEANVLQAIRIQNHVDAMNAPKRIISKASLGITSRKAN